MAGQVIFPRITIETYDADTLTCSTSYMDLKYMGGFVPYKKAMRAWGYLHGRHVVCFRKSGGRMFFLARAEPQSLVDRYRTVCFLCDWWCGCDKAATLVIARSIHMREHWRVAVTVDECRHPEGSLGITDAGDITCGVCSVVVGVDSFVSIIEVAKA